MQIFDTLLVKYSEFLFHTTLEVTHFIAIKQELTQQFHFAIAISKGTVQVGDGISVLTLLNPSKMGLACTAI